MSMLRNLPFSGDFSISLRFGDNKELFRQVSFQGIPLLGHPGIDYDLPPRTPVLAVQHGIVLDVRNDVDGYGNSVLLSHRWGQTFYAHLSEVRVEKGQQAAAGQTLGMSGDSGIVDHPILHFGLRLIPYSITDSWCGFTDPAPYLARLTQPRGAIIGPHIIGSIRPHLKVLSRWRPRMITLLDPSPDDLLALRDVCPDSIIVARIFVADHEMSERINKNPAEAAQWAHEITQARMAYGVDYWQVANEVNQDTEGLAKLNEFELARMTLADEAGYRCAILGFSVGNPDMPENDRMALWRQLYPALAYAEDHGHIVAVHEYGMPDLWGPNNAYDWYIYRLEHQVLRRLPFRKLKFAVTEYGIDGLIRGSEPSGWQNFTTPEGYVEQLLKCGRYVERFSGQILGYSIFTLGHYNPWQSYDIIGKAAAYLADLSEKGTWREIDAQVYDIVPRDTDQSVEVGPTIVAGKIPQDGDQRAAPESMLQTVDQPRQDIPAVVATAVLSSQDEPVSGETPSTFEPEPNEHAPSDTATDTTRPKQRRGKKPPTPPSVPEDVPVAHPEDEPTFGDESVDPETQQEVSTPTISEVTETTEVVMPAQASTLELQPETTAQEPTNLGIPEVEPPEAEQVNDLAQAAVISGLIASMSQEIDDERIDKEKSEQARIGEGDGAKEERAVEMDTPPAPPGKLVEQRIALPFAAYNMAIRGIKDRPDHPLDGQSPLVNDPADAADVVYLVKDLFMTYYGSWEPTGDYESVPEWARDDYLRPSFLEAGADHHLFAAVIGLDGEMRKGHEVIFWSDGYEKLEDPNYLDYTRERTKDSSGWANLFMAGGSSFVPQRGDIGPWCWAPSGASEVVQGGGLPVGHPVSTFVVWQAVKRADWEASFKPDTSTPVTPPPPTDGGSTEEPPPEGGDTTTTPTPTMEVERRISQWVSQYNITIKSVADRPDQPTGSVTYLVKDIFTTANGSWEPSSEPGSIPQWARDTYLKPFNAPDYFDDAGGDHHLFAAVIGLDGKLIRNEEIIYWSDGFEMLGDTSYNGYVHRLTKEKSGWANIITGPGSSFVPERKEQGPWCWAPEGAAEVVCGGGLPAKHHISFFVVWQAVAAGEGGSTGEGEQDKGDFNTYLPTTPAESVHAANAEETVVDPQLVEDVRKEAWIRLGYDLPKVSPLADYARRNKLGRPIGHEFESKGCRVQSYDQGVVIMPLDRPDQITHFSW